MIYYLLGLLISFAWIAFEMYRAPTMDNNGKVTKPGKKLKDLLKK